MRAARVATCALVGADGRGVAVAVLRWEAGGPRRLVTRRLRRGERVPPAYRALLLGLWEARRLGARALVLSTDDADVVAQVLGRADPPPGAAGPYLQARAMLHAFQSVEVAHLTPACDPDAAAASAEAAARVVPAPPSYADLPLWAAAS